MVYGTPFEKLEDEDRTAVSKKPKGIQDEIVTDERGKRRFHGAFTGGFSAGYFNTVGTKHGWVPQTFKSSREDRAEKLAQSAEDYMDDEDLGEFGIATRKLRTRVDFMDSLAVPGEKRLLAWERTSTTLSASTSLGAAGGDDGSLGQRLTGMLRPVNDSIGVRMLKKMGWRPGKGIGGKMTRRALERQKVIDAKSSGKRAEFDEETVKEIEEHMPGAEFSPDDISMFEIKPKEDVHGLGYKPLQDSGVLSEKYGVMASTLKTSKKSKGIRGQAFGVGAFEEDDEDIYTNYDLSQYDFEVGASSSSAQHDVPKFDSTFVPASTASKAQRKFYTAPMPPTGWRPNPNRVKALLERKQPHNLPESVLKISKQLTPFQRAKLLGERDHSVMELLSSHEREKLKQKHTRKEEHQRDGQQQRRNEAEPFEEEPMKAHRFKQYVSYLKRGIVFPQPVDMTRLEWEREQALFQDALPSELRALLPEVRDRQKPLAKIGFAAPIAEHLKSRFERESGADVKYEPSTSTDPKVDAVKAKQFGQATRQRHEWHPVKELCKHFNVPNPYPDSQIIGTPGLSRMSQKDYSAEYSLLDFGNGLRDTASEVTTRRHPSRFDQKPADDGRHQQKEVKKEPQEQVIKQEEERKDELAPMELLAAIFGDDDDEKEEDEEMPIEEEEERQPFLRLFKEKLPPEKKPDDNQPTQTPAARQGVITVHDLVEADDVYGPAMPPQEFLAREYVVEANGNGRTETELVTIDDNESSDGNSSSGEEERRRKKKSKRKKEKKHKKKAKKSKHKRRSGSFSE